MTREIPLSRGLVALVDDEDFAAVSQHGWCAVPFRHTTYARATIEGRQVYLHRFLMQAGPGQIVDHANRSGLDNRRANLRFCTNAQSLSNRSIPRKVNRFRGVQINTRGNKWRARLKHGGSVFSGRYRDSEQEAARDYDALAHQHYAEFAVLNFPLADLAEEAPGPLNLDLFEGRAQ